MQQVFFNKDARIIQLVSSEVILQKIDRDDILVNNVLTYLVNTFSLES